MNGQTNDMVLSVNIYWWWSGRGGEGRLSRLMPDSSKILLGSHAGMYDSGIYGAVTGIIHICQASEFKVLKLQEHQCTQIHSIMNFCEPNVP